MKPMADKFFQMGFFDFLFISKVSLLTNDGGYIPFRDAYRAGCNLSFPKEDVRTALLLLGRAGYLEIIKTKGFLLDKDLVTFAKESCSRKYRYLLPAPAE